MHKSSFHQEFQQSAHPREVEEEYSAEARLAIKYIAFPFNLRTRILISPRKYKYAKTISHVKYPEAKFEITKTNKKFPSFSYFRNRRCNGINTKASNKKTTNKP